MELPTRTHNDRFTAPGRYRELETQIRRRVEPSDTPILFIYAFDPRTRLGPFVFVDKTLIPGAPRAVGSALYAAGFRNVRLVLQQWNPHIRPSVARFDGKAPEVLMISAMQIHSAPAYGLIRDAWQLGEDRPLILAGGPKAVYEPWDFFGLSPDGRAGADVVVTGEEYVLLELLDRIVEMKRPGDSMRVAFERAREGGLLEDVPGLVYRPDTPDGPPEYLVNTGVQRLVQDLDELPLPFDAMGLFEPPHRQSTLSSHPVPAEQVGRHAKIVAMVTTHGCQFHCSYCPIPGYNQFTFRYRSPRRIVEEIAGVAERCGVSKFFGTDDNLFSRRETVEETFMAMARGKVGNRPFRKAITFGTEATEFDVFKNRDLLPLARDAGLRGLWLGIEDLTAGLVKKGQTVEKTKTLFNLLVKQGIAPMPMMMHHDGQPLWTWRGLYGLLNQVRFLRRAGAPTCQVTLLTPWVGSNGYEQPFREGLVLGKAGGQPIEDYQYDGNHCLATCDAHPWRRQINMLVSYAAFYNPLNLLLALPRFDKVWTDRIVFQLMGMFGMARSVYQSRDWLKRLISGPIERMAELPRSRFPMVAPNGVELCLIYAGGLHERSGKHDIEDPLLQPRSAFRRDAVGGSRNSNGPNRLAVSDAKDMPRKGRRGMSTRDERVAKLKAELDEWNAQIDELEAKARQAKSQAAQKRQERIAELNRKRDEAQEKLEEIQGAGEDAWESLKSGAEQVWENTKNTLQESKNAFFEGLQDDK